MLGTATAAGLERRFQVGDFSWPYYVRSGPAAWSELTDLVADLEADKLFLVADGGVPPALGAAVIRSLGAAGCPVVTLEAPSRESDKHVAYASDLIDEAFAARISRRSVVVGLGGGLAGNVAGWLAHQCLRDATRLIQIPTTLLAISDSVLSLKQGLNSKHGKNHVGGYKAPALVWSHLDFLDSLPPVEIRAGLGELAKNVMGIVPGRYDEVAALLRPDACYTPDVLLQLIDLCVDAKQAVMRQDPYERGPALVLELGHPQGHAVELLSRGGMPHGLAISVGCLTAARIADNLGLARDRGIEQAHEELLARMGAPIMFPPGITAEAILGVMSKDNQRGRLPILEGYAPLVLLEAPGRPVMTDADTGGFPQIPMYQVPLPVVRAGVQSHVIL